MTALRGAVGATAGLALAALFAAAQAQVLTDKDGRERFPVVNDGSGLSLQEIDPSLFDLYVDTRAGGRTFACETRNTPCTGVISFRFNNVRVEGGRLKWDSEVRAEVEPLAIFGTDPVSADAPANIFEGLEIYTHLNFDVFGADPFPPRGDRTVGEGTCENPDFSDGLLGGTVSLAQPVFASFLSGYSILSERYRSALAATGPGNVLTVPSLAALYAVFPRPSEDWGKLSSYSCEIASGQEDKPARLAFHSSGWLLTRQMVGATAPIKYTVRAANQYYWFPLDGAPAIVDAWVGNALVDTRDSNIPASGQPGYYIDVTFSEGVWGDASSTTAVQASAFDFLSIEQVVFTNAEPSMVEDTFPITPLRVTKPGGGALEGGETVVRLVFSQGDHPNFLGDLPDDADTLFAIRPMDMEAIYDASGNRLHGGSDWHVRVLHDRFAPYVAGANVTAETDNNGDETGNLKIDLRFSEQVKFERNIAESLTEPSTEDFVIIHYDVSESSSAYITVSEVEMLGVLTAESSAGAGDQQGAIGVRLLLEPPGEGFSPEDTVDVRIAERVKNPDYPTLASIFTARSDSTKYGAGFPRTMAPRQVGSLSLRVRKEVYAIAFSAAIEEEPLTVDVPLTPDPTIVSPSVLYELDDTGPTWGIAISRDGRLEKSSILLTVKSPVTASTRAQLSIGASSDLTDPLEPLFGSNPVELLPGELRQTVVEFPENVPIVRAVVTVPGNTDLMTGDRHFFIEIKSSQTVAQAVAFPSRLELVTREDDDEPLVYAQGDGDISEQPLTEDDLQIRGSMLSGEQVNIDPKASITEGGDDDGIVSIHVVLELTDNSGAPIEPTTGFTQERLALGGARLLDVYDIDLGSFTFVASSDDDFAPGAMKVAVTSSDGSGPLGGGSTVLSSVQEYIQVLEFFLLETDDDLGSQSTIRITLTQPPGSDRIGPKTQIYPFNIVPVNDPPIATELFSPGDFVLTTTETAQRAGRSIPPIPLLTDLDMVETGQMFQESTVTVTLSGDYPSNASPGDELLALALTVSGRGVDVAITVQPDKYGEVDFWVRLIDDGGTEEGGKDSTDFGPYRIRVEPVDNPPRFELASNVVSVVEGSPFFTVDIEGADNGEGDPGIAESLANGSAKVRVEVFETKFLDFEESFEARGLLLLDSTRAELVDASSMIRVGIAPGQEDANGEWRVRVTLEENDNVPVNLTTSRELVLVIEPVNDRPRMSWLDYNQDPPSLGEGPPDPLPVTPGNRTFPLPMGMADPDIEAKEAGLAPFATHRVAGYRSGSTLVLVVTGDTPVEGDDAAAIDIGLVDALREGGPGLRNPSVVITRSAVDRLSLEFLPISGLNGRFVFTRTSVTGVSSGENRQRLEGRFLKTGGTTTGGQLIPVEAVDFVLASAFEVTVDASDRSARKDRVVRAFFEDPGNDGINRRTIIDLDVGPLLVSTPAVVARIPEFFPPVVYEKGPVADPIEMGHETALRDTDNWVQIDPGATVASEGGDPVELIIVELAVGNYDASGVLGENDAVFTVDRSTNLVAVGRGLGVAIPGARGHATSYAAMISGLAPTVTGLDTVGLGDQLAADVGLVHYRYDSPYLAASSAQEIIRGLTAGLTADDRDVGGQSSLRVTLVPPAGAANRQIARQEYRLRITPVNDPPEATELFEEDAIVTTEMADVQTFPAIRILEDVSAVETGQSAQVSSLIETLSADYPSNVSDADELLLGLSVFPLSDGDVDVQAHVQPDKYGEVDFWVRLSDDGGTEDGGKDSTDFGPYKIRVEPVDNPPRFELASSVVSVVEGASFFPVGIEGADNGEGDPTIAESLASGSAKVRVEVFETKYFVAEHSGVLGRELLRLDFAGADLVDASSVIQVGIAPGQEDANGEWRVRVTLEENDNVPVNLTTSRELVLVIEPVNDRPRMSWLDDNQDPPVLGEGPPDPLPVMPGNRTFPLRMGIADPDEKAREERLAPRTNAVVALEQKATGYRLGSTLVLVVTGDTPVEGDDAAAIDIGLVDELREGGSGLVGPIFRTEPLVISRSAPDRLSFEERGRDGLGELRFTRTTATGVSSGENRQRFEGRFERGNLRGSSEVVFGVVIDFLLERAFRVTVDASDGSAREDRVVQASFGDLGNDGIHRLSIINPDAGPPLVSTPAVVARIPAPTPLAYEKGAVTEPIEMGLETALRDADNWVQIDPGATVASDGDGTVELIIVELAIGNYDASGVLGENDPVFTANRSTELVTVGRGLGVATPGTRSNATSYADMISRLAPTVTGLDTAGLGDPLAAGVGLVYYRYDSPYLAASTAREIIRGLTAGLTADDKDVGKQSSLRVTLVPPAGAGRRDAARQEYRLRITPVNDPPEATELFSAGAVVSSATETADVQTLPAIRILEDVSAVETGQMAQESTVTVTLSGDYPSNVSDADELLALAPTVSGRGVDVVITVQPGKYGAVDFWVRLIDDGGTANGGDDSIDFGPYRIRVEPVDNPPRFELVSDEVSVVEGASFFTVGIEGADNGEGDPGIAESLANGSAKVRVEVFETKFLDFELSFEARGLLRLDFVGAELVDASSEIRVGIAPGQEDANGEWRVRVTVEENDDEPMGLADGGVERVNRTTTRELVLVIEPVNDRPRMFWLDENGDPGEGLPDPLPVTAGSSPLPMGIADPDIEAKEAGLAPVNKQGLAGYGPGSTLVLVVTGDTPVEGDDAAAIDIGLVDALREGGPGLRNPSVVITRSAVDSLSLEFRSFPGFNSRFDFTRTTVTGVSSGENRQRLEGRFLKTGGTDSQLILEQVVDFVLASAFEVTVDASDGSTREDRVVRAFFEDPGNDGINRLTIIEPDVGPQLASTPVVVARIAADSPLVYARGPGLVEPIHLGREDDLRDRGNWKTIDPGATVTEGNDDDGVGLIIVELEMTENLTDRRLGRGELGGGDQDFTASRTSLLEFPVEASSGTVLSYRDDDPDTASLEALGLPVDRLGAELVTQFQVGIRYYSFASPVAIAVVEDAIRGLEVGLAPNDRDVGAQSSLRITLVPPAGIGNQAPAVLEYSLSIEPVNDPPFAVPADNLVLDPFPQDEFSPDDFPGRSTEFRLRPFFGQIDTVENDPNGIVKTTVTFVMSELDSTTTAHNVDNLDELIEVVDLQIGSAIDLGLGESDARGLFLTIEVPNQYTYGVWRFKLRLTDDHGTPGDPGDDASRTYPEGDDFFRVIIRNIDTTARFVVEPDPVARDEDTGDFVLRITDADNGPGDGGFTAENPGTIRVRVLDKSADALNAELFSRGEGEIDLVGATADYPISFGPDHVNGIFTFSITLVPSDGVVEVTKEVTKEVGITARPVNDAPRLAMDPNLVTTTGIQYDAVTSLKMTITDPDVQARADGIAPTLSDFPNGGYAPGSFLSVELKGRNAPPLTEDQAKAIDIGLTSGLGDVNDAITVGGFIIKRAADDRLEFERESDNVSAGAMSLASSRAEVVSSGSNHQRLTATITDNVPQGAMDAFLGAALQVSVDADDATDRTDRVVEAWFHDSGNDGESQDVGPAVASNLAQVHLGRGNAPIMYEKGPVEEPIHLGFETALMGNFSAAIDPSATVSDAEDDTVATVIMELALTNAAGERLGGGDGFFASCRFGEASAGGSTDFAYSSALSALAGQSVPVDPGLGVDLGEELTPGVGLGYSSSARGSFKVGDVQEQIRGVRVRLASGDESNTECGSPVPVDRDIGEHATVRITIVPALGGNPQVARQEYSLRITPVNDPPEATMLLSTRDAMIDTKESTPAQTFDLALLSDADPVETGQSLEASVVDLFLADDYPNNVNAGPELISLLSVTVSGVSLGVAPNRYGEFRFSLHLQDDGGTENGGRTAPTSARTGSGSRQ